MYDHQVIKSARITAMPKKFGDPMPQVMVTLDEYPNHEALLFEYYPDEISFTEKEFEGLTVAQARNMKFCKDYAYMRS
jgi:hypothetical protein